MTVPYQYGPQEFFSGFQKFFLFWVSMNFLQNWKAKLERFLSFRIQFGKLCSPSVGTNFKNMVYQVYILFLGFIWILLMKM